VNTFMVSIVFTYDYSTRGYGKKNDAKDLNHSAQGRRRERGDRSELGDGVMVVGGPGVRLIV
jgi:hypothetical protein